MPELQGSDQEDIKVALRKLRKRLRQIESLEKLTRPLTSEEIEKVSTKILILRNFAGLHNFRLGRFQTQGNFPFGW